MQETVRKRDGMPAGAWLPAVVTCIALAFWTVAPNTSHVPKLLNVLQDHAEMVAEHGHSHGLEEDLIWAMHGHNHDVADHDHSHAVLLQPRSAALPLVTASTWHGRALAHWSPPVFRLERPPRV